MGGRWGWLDILQQSVDPKSETYGSSGDYMHVAQRTVMMWGKAYCDGCLQRMLHPAPLNAVLMHDLERKVKARERGMHTATNWVPGEAISCASSPSVSAALLANFFFAARLTIPAGRGAAAGASAGALRRLPVPGAFSWMFNTATAAGLCAMSVSAVGPAASAESGVLDTAAAAGRCTISLSASGAATAELSDWRTPATGAATGSEIGPAASGMPAMGDAAAAGSIDGAAAVPSACCSALVAAHWPAARSRTPRTARARRLMLGGLAARCAAQYVWGLSGRVMASWSRHRSLRSSATKSRLQLPKPTDSKECHPEPFEKWLI